MKCLLLLLLFTGVISISARAQEYEDNDFAEFEVFEEEEEVIDEEDEDQGNEEGLSRGGVRQDGGGTPAGSRMDVEDEEEAVVEVRPFGLSFK